MPIRINLKELFPADSQEITVDKINFNFNKLLELGIGEQGLRGFSGIQGAAGPEGNDGPSGIRGASWFVGSGNPTLTDDPNDPDDLLVGDFFLDSTNLAVWRWNGTSWAFLFNIGAIINNYLAATPSPFTRGFGIDPLDPNNPDPLNQDRRFILFNNREDRNLDVNPGGVNLNSTTNDVLFLNNFDENTIDALSPFIYGPTLTPTPPQTDTMDYFNSLLSVYVDHTITTAGRFHLELGTLYDDAGDPRLTNVFENFKMRLVRESSSIYPADYSKAVFLVDVPDSSSPIQRQNYNLRSVFEFRSPRFDISNTVINERSSFYIGSRYGLDEIVGIIGVNLADGALFYSENGEASNLGLNLEYTIPSFPSETGYVTNNSTKNYFWLDSVDSVDAIYLDDTTYQNGGNIIQIGTTSPRQKWQEPPTYVPTVAHSFAGIAIEGGTIYTVNGATTGGFLTTDFGYFNRYTIENPNRPKSDFANGYKVNGLTEYYNIYLSFFDPDQAYYLDGSRPVSGAQVADVAVSGGKIFTVHNMTPLQTASDEVGGPIPFNPKAWYDRIYFQSIAVDEPAYNLGTSHYPVKLGRIGGNDSVDFPNENYKLGSESYTLNDPEELYCAWRVMLNGENAIVATNGLHQPNSYWNSFAGEDANYVPPTNGYYSGNLTAIDVKDAAHPRIIESFPVPLNTSYFTPTFTVGESYAGIMDMDIVSNRAYTLTWRQGLDPNTGRTSFFGDLPWSIYVDVFDLSGLADPSVARGSRITWLGRSSVAVASASISYGVSPEPYRDKFGAICANEKYVYVGYANTIQIFNTIAFGASQAFYEDPACFVGCAGQLNYPREINYSMITTSSAAVIYDIKTLGNSLYILYKDGEPYKLRKYDISGGVSAQPSLTEIWTKTLPNPAHRFVISGKHIYVSTTSPDGSDQDTTGGLTVIDFDGIYTSGAHIEALRADEVNITGDLSIGGDLNLNNSLNVGGDARIDGSLAVTGNIQADLTHIKVTQTPYETNLSWSTTGPWGQIIPSNLFSSVRLVFNSEEYDTLSEFLKATTGSGSPVPSGHSKFTVKNNGYYHISLTSTFYLNTEEYSPDWLDRVIWIYAWVDPIDPAESSYAVNLFYNAVTSNYGGGGDADGSQQIPTNGSATQYLKEGDIVEIKCFYFGQLSDLTNPSLVIGAGQNGPFQLNIDRLI